MIRLLQHYTPNFKPLIGISRPIHEEYCRLHGYSFYLKEVPEYGVYNGLEKLNQILEVCEDGDWAFVMDADSVITNLNLAIESLFEPNKDWYLSEGLNMGVFLIKSTKLNRSIIDIMYKEIECRIFSCEQDAIMIHSKFIPTLSIKKHPCFNSYLSELYPEIPQPVSEEQGQCVEGKSFVLHLTALPLEKRIEIMINTKITK